MKARLHRTPVMEVHRKVLDHQKVVYLLVANRAIQYKRDKFRIAYIGMTSRGNSSCGIECGAQSSEYLVGLRTEKYGDLRYHLPPAAQSPDMDSLRKSIDSAVRAVVLATAEMQRPRNELPLDSTTGSVFQPEGH
jgi:hypothetical protein